MLTRSHVSSGFPAMVTAEAAALFGNVRVPAALVAGASLPLGFAFALPSSEDKLGVRALKGLNLALGFLAVQSELLSVVVATNAINRLTAGGMACVTEGSVTTVMELFRNDPTLLQHWLGTYIHFVGGVFCIVLIQSRHHCARIWARKLFAAPLAICSDVRDQHLRSPPLV